MENKEKLSSYVKRSLIFVHESFATKEALFEHVYQKVLDLGWVRADFLERLKQREETFPTGIQLETFGVAIPHTDAECILHEFVAVITNERSVTFRSMEDKNQHVPADIVFILGLNQPHAQLGMLQSLMCLLQNEHVLAEILSAAASEEVFQVIEKNNV